jgi:hypothetical protein
MMSHTDIGIVGATTDSFILFENGVRRNRLRHGALHRHSAGCPSTMRAVTRGEAALLHPVTRR